MSTGGDTSFLERQNGAERGRDARKVRRSSRFSKDRRVHEAMPYLTKYGYNFCWAVRALRLDGGGGSTAARSPAMAAGVTDPHWT